MVHSCCVPGCSNNSLKNKNVSFHSFPKNDKKLRESWIRAINRRGSGGRYKLWRPKLHDRICGVHFATTGTNKKLGVPVSSLKMLAEPKTKCLSGSRLKIINGNNIDVGNEVIITSPNRCDKENILNVKCKTHVKEDSQGTAESYDHNYHCATVAAPTIIELQQTIEKLNDMVGSLKQKLRAEEIKSCALSDKVKVLECKNCRLLQQQTMKKTRSTILQTSTMGTGQLHYYTGFRDHTLYNNFRDFIHQGYLLAKTMLYPNFIEHDKRRKLLFEDELLLVLMKLRLGLLHQDLAYRFNISHAIVSDIWNFWLELLSTQLPQVPIWPNREIIQKHMSDKFKTEYPNTRVILDCTEIFIERPSSCEVQNATYCNYKHHNTAKGLLGIAPNGFVSFVSPLYPGRTSDKEIVIKSGIIDLLEEGDDVMADRGFPIEDLLKEKKVTLNIPPIISNEDTKNTVKMASNRIHIERVIRVVEKFRILKYVFPNSMHHQLNNIWITCCYLSNFMDVPLLERNTVESTDIQDEF